MHLIQLKIVGSSCKDAPDVLLPVHASKSPTSWRFWVAEPSPTPCNLFYTKRSCDLPHMHVMTSLVTSSHHKMMSYHKDIRFWWCTSDAAHHPYVTIKNVKNCLIWHVEVHIWPARLSGWATWCYIYLSRIPILLELLTQAEIQDFHVHTKWWHHRKCGKKCGMLLDWNYS